ARGYRSSSPDPIRSMLTSLFAGPTIEIGLPHSARGSGRPWNRRRSWTRPGSPPIWRRSSGGSGRRGREGRMTEVSSVLLVAATRSDPDTFHTSSLLGRSLQRLAADRRLTSAITFNNAAGLPSVYNPHIAEANRSQVLLFLHDDVWIDDF